MRGVLVIVVFVVGTSTHAQFYVDPGGSDLAVGDAANPWRTLQHAASQVSAGDRVTVRAGDYVGFHLTTSGTASAPIEFFAEPGVLVNADNPVTPDGINLEGASHIVIDGFGVTNASRAGVRAVGPVGSFAEFVTIRNVTAFDNTRWGIFTGFVNDLLIEDNRTSGSEIEHGIYVSNSGDRPVIQRNEVWGNRANGIHMNGDASVGGDGIISDALVSQNTIYDNGLGGGSGINMDGVVDSRIENNLIYDTHASGISLYRIDGGAPSTGNVVVNNTVHVASDGRWALNIQDGSTDNTARNNILLNEHNFRGALDICSNCLDGFVSDYNLFINRITTNGGNSVLSLDEWQTATGNDAHSLVSTADELFVDWQAGNYQLRVDSPARDAGTDLDAPAFDLVGNSRPVGPAHDLGALEWNELTWDTDLDGDVDGTDFLQIQRVNPALIPQWQAEYSSNSLIASSQAVPEPQSALLATLAGLLICIRRAGRA